MEAPLIDVNITTTTAATASCFRYNCSYCIIHRRHYAQTE